MEDKMEHEVILHLIESKLKELKFAYKGSNKKAVELYRKELLLAKKWVNKQQ